MSSNLNEDCIPRQKAVLMKKSAAEMNNEALVQVGNGNLPLAMRCFQEALDRMQAFLSANEQNLSESDERQHRENRSQATQISCFETPIVIQVDDYETLESFEMSVMSAIVMYNTMLLLKRTGNEELGLSLLDQILDLTCEDGEGNLMMPYTSSSWHPTFALSLFLHQSDMGFARGTITMKERIKLYIEAVQWTHELYHEAHEIKAKVFSRLSTLLYEANEFQYCQQAAKEALTIYAQIAASRGSNNNISVTNILAVKNESLAGNVSVAEQNLFFTAPSA